MLDIEPCSKLLIWSSLRVPQSSAPIMMSSSSTTSSSSSWSVESNPGMIAWLLLFFFSFCCLSNSFSLKYSSLSFRTIHFSRVRLTYGYKK